MRAVIYARFSSNNQREESITAQLRKGHDYCQKEGYTVVREYIDEAKSGKTIEKRDAFRAMMNDSAYGEFDVMVTHKFDRFARNRMEAALVKHHLMQNNVRIEYVEYRIDGSPESVMLEAVMEGQAEFFSLNLSREVIKGQTENVHQGKYNGGPVPLGYDIVNGFYSINEKEAQVIRTIFRMRLEGKTYGEVLAHLNESGMKTKKGERFGKNSLYDILRNPKYCGDYVHGKQRGASRLKNIRTRTTDMTPRIKVENAIPAIITREEWQTMQEMLNTQKRGPQPRSERYLLTGFVRCGQCGSSMTGTKITSKKSNVSYEYYRCDASANKKACKSTKIRKDFLEAEVLKEFRRIIKKDTHTKEFWEKVATAHQKMQVDYKDVIVELEQEEKRLNIKLRNLLDIAAEGGAHVAKEIKRIGDELDLVTSTLQDKKNKATQLISSTSYLKSLFKELEKDSPANDRAIVEVFLDRAVITETEVQIYLKLPSSQGKMRVSELLVTPEGFEPPAS